MRIRLNPRDRAEKYLGILLLLCRSTSAKVEQINNKVDRIKDKVDK